MITSLLDQKKIKVGDAVAEGGDSVTEVDSVEVAEADLTIGAEEEEVDLIIGVEEAVVMTTVVVIGVVVMTTVVVIGVVVMTTVVVIGVVVLTETGAAASTEAEAAASIGTGVALTEIATIDAAVSIETRVALLQQSAHVCS